jgi:secreted Zn-dependent insulinase-like peptidase
MKNTGPQLKLYNTIKDYVKVEFDWQEKGSSEMSTVSRLAAALTRFEPQDILTGDTLIDEIDPELVKQSFENLKPSNLNFAHATKLEIPFTEKDSESTDENNYGGKNDIRYSVVNNKDKKSVIIKEKYYNILYKKEKMSNEFMDRLINAKLDKKKFALPEPLKYVPTDVSLIKTIPNQTQRL